VLEGTAMNEWEWELTEDEIKQACLVMPHPEMHLNRNLQLEALQQVAQAAQKKLVEWLEQGLD